MEWRGEGVVERHGGGKGGVVESDGGEREEWWTVLHGGRGKGWGLMEGEGVLLGHHCPCARSSSCLWAVVMHRWRIGGVVHGRWVVGGLVHVGGLFVGVVVMCRLLCGHH